MNLTEIQYNQHKPTEKVGKKGSYKRRKHMSKIVESSVELIGKTPLLRAKRYAAKANATAIIFAYKALVIIPARYGSSRLEGKPLLKVNDKPIIQWVYEKAQQSKLADMIVVATDDERIFNAVKGRYRLPRSSA